MCRMVKVLALEVPRLGLRLRGVNPSSYVSRVRSYSPLSIRQLVICRNHSYLKYKVCFCLHLLSNIFYCLGFPSMRSVEPPVPVLPSYTKSFEQASLDLPSTHSIIRECTRCFLPGRFSLSVAAWVFVPQSIEDRCSGSSLYERERLGLLL